LARSGRYLPGGFPHARRRRVRNRRDPTHRRLDPWCRSEHSGSVS
jgi:hypothetical protein